MSTSNFTKIGQFLSVRFAQKDSVVILQVTKAPCNRSFSAKLKFLKVESVEILTFAHITTKILKFLVYSSSLKREKS